ncbi:phytoene/squalene synthase family protein [Sphingosinicella sp. GR2756]|uniref:Phytoene/squalene synthase family protein n=1 Tax=Sphingosinicella rhizophila TaxID=3050082 RepID=A0ABU3Q6D6_9SPHN|nr:phytoene/squalene synthase family protein [Sphingosinicella sp. GR2756]MDT9598972.1 phytoene/squalene synthase family protein [Sphingosinicella sp. GR2756]
MADRRRLVAEARATIARGSKSFRTASRLFDRETRERAWLLYAWCRACDDLADGQTLGHDARAGVDGAAAIALMRARTAAVLAGEEVGDMPFDALGLVARECSIPHAFIQDHLQGFALDAEGWRPRTEHDLLTYCYHVAGAVGCMMAVLMGVDANDTDTLDRASDLGIAFQLANIARDVGADHAAGRCYLPVSWLDEHGLCEDGLMEPASRAELAILAARLDALAAVYEDSARVGARRLPFRSRWAVLSAAGIYGAIAREVARRGPAAWDERVRIGKPDKLRHMIAAWREAGRPAAAAVVARTGLWTRRVRADPVLPPSASADEHPPKRPTAPSISPDAAHGGSRS